MKRFPHSIICLIIIAFLAGCVLPGSQPSNIPPTITSVFIPPTEAGSAPVVTDTPAVDVVGGVTPAPLTPTPGAANPGIVRLQLITPPMAGGQAFTVTLLVNNRTRQPLTGTRAVLSVPGGLEVVEILDGGAIENGEVFWELPDLPANNGRVEVRVSMRFRSAINSVLFENIRLDAPGLDPTLVEVSGLRYVFPGDVMPIQAVQGTGDQTPYEGETVSIEGSVIAIFPGLEGFFLFQMGTFLDGASQGIFVQAPSMTDTVHVGQTARIRGEASEVEGQTTLILSSPDDVQVIDEKGFMPGPYEFDPPQDPEESLRYFEAKEGMPVAVQGGEAVSPITRYGEFVIVYSKHGVTRLFQGEENGYAIMIDDGSNREHADASTLPVVVHAGDHFNGVHGIVAYTFGRFKVEPINQYTVNHLDAAIPSVEPAGENEISVMTWNVENLFDAFPPNPSDPPLPSPEKYALDLEKVVGTINAAGAPDVVALQEVENITVLQDIAGAASLAQYAYQPVLEEGSDQRGIDVGYLVRSDRLDVVQVRQYAENQGVYTRPPLLLTVRPKSGGAPISLINNHFTSMNSGVEESEPRRVLQAQGNLSIVEELRETDPNAQVAVLGDLNAFYHSAPIDVLRGGGLTHALEKVPPEQRFTYNYQGESQVLDHVLVTDPLWQRIARVEILHINSDSPPPMPDDPSPTGKSDHDPVIVVFAQ